MQQPRSARSVRRFGERDLEWVRGETWNFTTSFVAGKELQGQAQARRHCLPLPRTNYQQTGLCKQNELLAGKVHV